MDTRTAKAELEGANQRVTHLSLQLAEGDARYLQIKARRDALAGEAATLWAALETCRQLIMTLLQAKSELTDDIKKQAIEASDKTYDAREGTPLAQAAAEVLAKVMKAAEARSAFVDYADHAPETNGAEWLDKSRDLSVKADEAGYEALDAADAYCALLKATHAAS